MAALDKQDSKHCTCKTFCFKGEIFKSDFPSLSHSDAQQFYSKGSTIYTIRPKGIHILDETKVYVSVLSQNVYELRCLNCQTIFRVAVKENTLYLYFIDDNTVRTHRGRSFSGFAAGRPLSHYFPIPLRPFFNTHLEIASQSSFASSRVSTNLDQFALNLEDNLKTPEIDSEDDDFKLMFSCENETYVGSYKNSWMDSY